MYMRCNNACVDSYRNGCATPNNGDGIIRFDDRPRIDTRERGYEHGFEYGFECGFEESRRQGFCNGYRPASETGRGCCAENSFERSYERGFENGFEEGVKEASRIYGHRCCY